MRFRPTKLQLGVIALSLALLPFCARVGVCQDPGPRKAPNWSPEEFPISYWAGPPEPFVTKERFQEIKDSGMTFVTPVSDEWPSIETNKKILTFCQELGMKAFISDERLAPAFGNVDSMKAKIDAVVAEYRNYPALAGYTVKDEPSSTMFDDLGEIAAYLRLKDPTREVYINLYPNYVTVEGMGVPTYEEYVRLFQQKVRPFALSYDNYNFTLEGDRPEFITNLAIMRRLSLEFDTPFWQIVQVVQFGGHRNLTEAELRWEAMQTLVYGAKGLLWFTYWQPGPEEFKHSMILRDGTRDPHYDMVRRVNAEVRVIGKELLKATSVAVFHTGNIPPGADKRVEGMPVITDDKKDLAIGLFRRNQSEQLALVSNSDYKNAVQTELRFFSGEKLPLLLDTATGEWKKPTAQPQLGGYSIEVELPPAGALLFKW